MNFILPIFYPLYTQIGHSQILLTQNALPPAQNAEHVRSLALWVAEVTALALVHPHISWCAQPNIKCKKLNHTINFIIMSPKPLRVWKEFCKKTNLHFVDSFPPCKFLKFSLDLSVMKALNKQRKSEISHRKYMEKLFFLL